jgi:hypothetical protein
VGDVVMAAGTTPLSPPHARAAAACSRHDMLFEQIPLYLRSSASRPRRATNCVAWRAGQGGLKTALYSAAVFRPAYADERGC